MEKRERKVWWSMNAIHTRKPSLGLWKHIESLAEEAVHALCSNEQDEQGEQGQLGTFNEQVGWERRG